MPDALQLVWFKRDVRVQDHAPLMQAVQAGPVLPLYIVEPELWMQPDMSLRHWHFLSECIDTLDQDLTRLGQPLIVRHGEAEDVFREIFNAHAVAAVWSHQETGNGWTFGRDTRVAELLRARDIPWHELRQHGVLRGRVDRDAWSRQWERLMAEPVLPPPDSLPPIAMRAEAWPQTPHPALHDDPCPGRQRGGRASAEQVLYGFLQQRGERYHQRMSSPLTAADSCSRLSAHLAWGTLSMREVVQVTRQRRAQVKALTPADRGTWARALSAFEGRLHWHCHFIQKLESEPRIEFENMQRSMDGLRDPVADPERFHAWSTGNTGWPLVDACMRCLQHTGWINFRMRAMLQAVASYHYWLHWRETSLHLARLFTDYEPGIHYPQAQMQSGTTGINTTRIYNPIKQSMDQDPQGVFIRRWVPALAAVSKEWIHQPWMMSDALQQRSGCVIGQDYPAPLLDHEVAAREARQRLSAYRKRDAARDERRKIYQKHGSRKRPSQRSRAASSHRQGELPL